MDLANDRELEATRQKLRLLEENLPSGGPFDFSASV